MPGEIARTSGLPSHLILRALLDIVDDAVTVVDRAGTVVAWNRAAEALYGVPAEDILGRPITDFFSIESLAVHSVLATGAHIDHAYHRPRPDVHVLISAAPVRDENGEIAGAIAVERDMTVLVRMGEENARYLVQTQCDLLQTQTVERALEALTAPGGPRHALVVGELGTGKRTLAEASHRLLRLEGPFLAVRAEPRAAALMDVALFGADGSLVLSPDARREGWLERAAGGTLLLQDVHLMPSAVQAKLARAIEEERFRPLGGQRDLPLRCRILATAPTADAIDPALVRALPRVELPPMAERRNESLLFFHFWLKRWAKERGVLPPRLSEEAAGLIQAYPWPGNLAEMAQAARRAVSLAEGEVRPEHLPEAVRAVHLRPARRRVPLAHQSKELERARIREALEESGGNKSRAAQILGISRAALYYKLKQHGMDEITRSRRPASRG
ncbi:sigma-54-dependent Fis family transcriptional regulator [Alicyclobacillus acidocaldarius]|uniref:PAS modulated sigma54 specific transcriptional regulator, Fis family n=1 Tax=Alicyclobacillus acidocaldarius (strain Tc-4-1) TaxID=1048834 RepID=F8IJK2_ALIAT|nr:sigma-54-dependent Fis family transcriptional regulator [Alicyclobacillus acidocaldarius]AEJ44715.1 PAS modulated sigma54 specific transcriptional regulator, Fis family [Alicyclobacillus acidocaldarius subsp. acidocaldarius Tc-4-1]